MKPIGEGRYQTRGAFVRVPMCGGCRRDLISRRVLAVIGGLGAAGGVFAWWFLDTNGDPNYLVVGGVIALVVGFVVMVALSWLCDNRLSRVAHIEVDGSDIEFTNPEYQRRYIGESRDWRHDTTDNGEGRWR
jgi:hypothetical protein